MKLKVIGLSLVQDYFSYQLDKKCIEYFLEYRMGQKAGRIKFNDIFQTSNQQSIKLLLKVKFNNPKPKKIMFNLYISKNNNLVQNIGNFELDVRQILGEILSNSQSNEITKKKIIDVVVQKKFEQPQQTFVSNKGTVKL